MTSILLVTIDSLRADHVSCYGYERETTPRIDQLAANGHLFERAFAHAPTTRKSFPTILASSYPLMYGGYDRISEGRTLVSELLSSAGYRTGGFHSNPYLGADFGYSSGFDAFYDAQSDPSLLAQLRQYVSKNLDSESRIFQLLKRTFETTEKHAGLEVGSAYMDAVKLTDKATGWLESTGSDRSFLWAHYMDVHHPYLPDEEYQTQFRDSPVSERRAVQLRRKMLEHPDDITSAERQTLIDLYDAEIRYTDEQVGRLVDEATEHWGEEFVLILTADHGEEFAEHGQYSHNTYHSEGIHVPLLVADNSTSGRYDEVVGLLDVAPTIADYAGTEQPDNFYGYSLRKLMRDSEWPRDYIIGNSGDPEPGERQFFYRDERWMYMRFDDEEHLYDVVSDPEEQTDVLADNPDVATDIRTEVDRHVETLGTTARELDEVEMDDAVRERLQLLGYKE